MAPSSRRPTRFARSPLLVYLCVQVCQIAVNNAIDYATVLGQVREARQQGLTVPVLLMGELPLLQRIALLNPVAIRLL